MTKQPNILLITSDQQHWDTLGINNPRIKTPALDRLANEGALFDRAYCANPVCSPSRATLITGLYPAWHHCWTIGVKLPEDVPTVGETFMENGYYTALVGKAHFQPTASEPGSESVESHPIVHDLDFWRKFRGPWYGFENIELTRNHADEAHAGQHYGVWLEDEKGVKDWKKYYQTWPREEDYKPRYKEWELPEELHYTTWTGERTIANIEKAVEDDKPFFIWSSYHDPHPPYLVSSPWADMYDPDDMQTGEFTEGEFDNMPPHFGKTREEKPDFSMYRETWGPHGFSSHLIPEEKGREYMAIYYGMISFMDKWIGKTLDALDRLGIADNTLVVFTTDHGHFLGQHGLRAKGAFHYEDMIRIPMLARWPGQIDAGRTVSALQSQVDFPSTFLSAAGIEVPGVMQGVDQLPVWEGEDERARDHIIVENRHEPTLVHLRTFVDERHKITVYRNADYGELFDLQEDPGEVKNLWDDPESQELKKDLLLKFMQAELQREPTRMPRIAGA